LYVYNIPALFCLPAALTFITASLCVVYIDYKQLYQGLSFACKVLAHCGCSVKRRWRQWFSKFSTFWKWIYFSVWQILFFS